MHIPGRPGTVEQVSVRLGKAMVSAPPRMERECQSTIGWMEVKPSTSDPSWDRGEELDFGGGGGGG